jgi:hypothetical protein
MPERFRLLPELPVAPWPEHFSAGDAGRSSHANREGARRSMAQGTVVEFTPKGGPAWIGNFQPGGVAFNAVAAHPDGASVVVVAGGTAYVVDPETHLLQESFGSSIQGLVELPEIRLLIVNHDMWMEALAPEGRLWRSRAVSWNGISNTMYMEGRLYGMGWDEYSKSQVAFSIDVFSGEAEGGAGPWDFDCSGR